MTSQGSLPYTRAALYISCVVGMTTVWAGRGSIPGRDNLSLFKCVYNVFSWSVGTVDAFPDDTAVHSPSCLEVKERVDLNLPCPLNLHSEYWELVMYQLILCRWMPVVLCD